MKNRIPIVVAVVLGIVAVLAINSYVKRMKEETEQKYRGKPVIAARSNIPAGGEIGEKMLTLKKVPSQYIPRQAMTTPEERRQIIGRKTRVPIRAGQLILWSDLEMEKRGGLSALIPEGERAFSVGIEAGIKSALLQINDRVDILGIFSVPQDDPGVRAGVGIGAGDDTACVVLLQNVNIIALGTTIGSTRGGAADAGGGGQITFSVTLPEAQLLLFSEQHGDLALALRREGEIEVMAREDLPRVTMEQLEDITRELDGKRQARVIQVRKGTEVEEVTIELDDEGEIDTFE